MQYVVWFLSNLSIGSKLTFPSIGKVEKILYLIDLKNFMPGN